MNKLLSREVLDQQQAAQMTTRFRGYRIDGKGWIEGSLILKFDGSANIAPLQEHLVEGICLMSFPVYNDSVGQNTLWTDCLGRQIYGSIYLNGKLTKGGDVLGENVNIDGKDTISYEPVIWSIKDAGFCVDESFHKDGSTMESLLQYTEAIFIDHQFKLSKNAAQQPL